MASKLTIKDIEWSFTILEDDIYESNYGKDSHGITLKDYQKVYFKKTSFSQKLVLHELFHAYVSSCCVNSLQDLTSDDMEEISAEIIEFHIDDIAKYGKKLYNSLSRQIKAKEDKPQKASK